MTKQLDGFRVSVVSPATQATVAMPLRLRAGMDWLRAQGAEVELMPTAASPQPWPDVASRADDVVAAMKLPDEGVIAASVGGNGTIGLIPHLRAADITRSRRPLHGGSDITTLLWWAHHELGARCFYGPMVAMGLAEQPHVRNLTAASLFDAWHGRTATYRPAGSWTEEQVPIGAAIGEPLLSQQRADTGAAQWRALRHGDAEGRLLIGCLEVLVWWIRPLPAWSLLRSGPVVLALDIALAGGRWGSSPLGGPTGVDALLHAYTQSGGWDGVAGVIVGRPRGYTVSERRHLDDVLLRHVPAGIPLLVDVDLGHTEPSLTLPLGGRFRMRTNPAEIHCGPPLISQP